MGGWQWTVLGHAAVAVGRKGRRDAGVAIGLFLRLESCVDTIVVDTSWDKGVQWEYSGS
jgi:hypothetical protein